MKLHAMSERTIRTYHELAEEDRSGMAVQVGEQRARVRARLTGVRHLVPVTSGKGGVGKSFVSACLAAALRALGHETGLLDADLNGASTRRLLGVPPGRLIMKEGAVVPPVSRGGVKLMSIDLLLRDEMPIEWRGPETDSFLWRGAREHGVVREFLADVEWGDLDFLIIDLPPGARRLIDVMELVEDVAGCLVVTIPSAASKSVVERAVKLALGRGTPLLGIVENMSAYACAECGRTGALFAGEAGRELAAAFDVPLLAAVPFDPRAARFADDGDVESLLAETAAGAALRDLASAVAEGLVSAGELRP